MAAGVGNAAVSCSGGTCELWPRLNVQHIPHCRHVGRSVRSTLCGDSLSDRACDLMCVAPEAKVTGHVGTDNYQGGNLAGQAMIEALGEEGGKLLILHFKQANSCVLRVQGFREVIDEYNQNRQSGRIEIVAEQDGGGLRDEGFAATAAAIQTDSDLTGIFALNEPSALGAYAALEQAGKTEQVTIVAFDGQEDGKRAIKEGKVYADPIQFPDKMGRITMQHIVKYLNGEPFEKEMLIPTELYRWEDAGMDPELR